MKKTQLLAWMVLGPLALLAQQEVGKTIMVDEAEASGVKPAAVEPAASPLPSAGLVAVPAGGSVLDAAHAVVAQVQGRVLLQDLLDEAELTVLKASTNLFTTGMKSIPWQKAMEEVLRPASLRYFDDGMVVKIGSGVKVDALYAAQEMDRLAANHSRIEVNFAGGTPIAAALRVVQRLAGVNMNFDYMKAEHRGMASAVAPVGATEGQTVTVQAAPPETQTTYATPDGQQVEWRAVLKEVLDPIGYTFIEDNGTVKPMPVEQLVKFNQAKINARPLVTKITKVSHGNPEIIVEKIKKMNLLKHEKAFMDITYGKDDNAKTFKGSSGGQIQSGSSGQQVGAQMSSGGASFGQLNRPRSPQGIIMADVEENLAAIEKQIKLLDTRDRQVLIEALILQVSDAMMQELGVKWGDLRMQYNSQYPYGNPGVRQEYKVSSDGTVAMKEVKKPLLNPDGTPVKDSNGAGVLVTEMVPDLVTKIASSGLVGLDDWNGKITENRFAVAPISFDAVIKMIQGDTYSRSLGSPILTVGDHGEAVIQIAKITPVEQTTISYIGTQDPTAATSTEWLSLQTGNMLWVSPEISEDGKFVRLSVHPQITDVSGEVTSSTDQKNYIVTSQELDTRVNVPSGEVLLLGGLTTSAMGDTVSKVPLLGDIPLIGRLFRYKGTSRQQSHLVLLIRPTVLDDDQPNTGFERPSMKIVDPMQQGIGKTLAPNKGEDPIVAKEKSLLEKMGWRKKEEETEPVATPAVPPAEPSAEAPAAPVNHGSAEAAGK